MRRTLLTILLALSITMGLAQEVLKGRTESVSYKLAGKPWTPDEETSCLITMTNERLTIYSNVRQEFDIVCEIPDPYTPNPASLNKVVMTSSWKVVDRKGTQCKIQVVGYEGGALQLFVVYTDVSFCYQFKVI